MVSCEACVLMKLSFKDHSQTYAGLLLLRQEAVDELKAELDNFQQS